MKKILAIALVAALVALCTSALWHAVDLGNAQVQWEGDDIDGPFAVAVASLAIGGGLLIGGMALVGALAFTGVVMAGVGVMLLVGMVLGLAVLLLCVTPLLLPVLLPLAIIAYFVSRSRKQRRLAAQPA